jgi:hypothetical protein|tara:strand:+ start:187 stop:477 length:291 start_codon:yes stop_codon:yes gene_type:complete
MDLEKIRSMLQKEHGVEITSENKSTTEPSGSIEAILEEFPNAEIVNEGELYCQCEEKYSYNMQCISCDKPVKPRQPEIFVCNCEYGHQNCTCDGGQ